MKNCLDCGLEFIKRGQNHKRCDSCAVIETKRRYRQWSLDYVVTGEGSGSKTKPEQLNPSYKHGKSVFDRWARERLETLGCCERCGKTLRRGKGQFCGHHKDHNNLNNVKENLELLCARCHLIEHECWKAFEGVTTILKGSTQETVEAPSPEKSGDDIVCSA